MFVQIVGIHWEVLRHFKSLIGTSISSHLCDAHGLCIRLADLKPT